MEELKAGGMDPPALRNEPEVPMYLSFYVTAFWVLSGRRSAGMGLNPISLQEMVSYLKLYPWYDIDEFVSFIVAMDQMYLEHKNGREEVSPTSSN